MELPLALLTDAAHWDCQAIGGVDGVEVAIDLPAQGATRVRMVLATAHAHGATIFNIDLPGAGVGAIVNAVALLLACTSV